MVEATVRLRIPLAALLESIAELDPAEKRRLWEALDEQMAQADEDMSEQDPTVQAEITAARVAYAAGDYVTIDEYLARRGKRTS